jgi:hypothetical protein
MTTPTPTAESFHGAVNHRNEITSYNFNPFAPTSRKASVEHGTRQSLLKEESFGGNTTLFEPSNDMSSNFDP